jgi:GNAT superfamily N-acetyltransferase
LRANLCVSTTCLRLRKDVRAPIPSEIPEQRPLRIERGDLAALEAWRRSRITLVPMDFCADRTHGLRHFYLGRWNGSVAHILWLAGEGDPSTVSDWELRTGVVEFRNVHTLGAFRRKGIFRSVAQAALREIRDQGIATAYAHVDEHNSASLEGFLKLGFRPVHRIRILRVLGWDRIQQSTIDGC